MTDNENCLEGIACPSCGQADSFGVQATAWFDVTDDGTEFDYSAGGPEWDDSSPIICRSCYNQGTVGDFRKK